MIVGRPLRGRKVRGEMRTVLAVIACVALVACGEVDPEGAADTESARKGKLEPMPEEPYDPEPELEPAPDASADASADAGAPAQPSAPDAGALPSTPDAGDAATAPTLPAPDAGAQTPDAGAAAGEPVTFFDGRPIWLEVNSHEEVFTFRVNPDDGGNDGHVERFNRSTGEQLPDLAAWMIAPDVWTVQRAPYDRFDFYFDTAKQAVLEVKYEAQLTIKGKTYVNTSRGTPQFVD